MIIKTFVLLTALTVTPVNPVEKPPPATVTITVELAEKLVQSRVAAQAEIDQLKFNIYQYQMALSEARTKMCA